MESERECRDGQWEYQGGCMVWEGKTELRGRRGLDIVGLKGGGQSGDWERGWP